MATWTEEQFDEAFTTVPSPADESAIWDYTSCRPVNHGIPDERVWSVLEGEGGLYLTPGYRIVNLVGYVVTEEPHTEEHDEVDVLWLPDTETGEYDPHGGAKHRFYEEN